MTPDRRTGWLADLKAGDPVRIMQAGSPLAIGTVRWIAPNGALEVRWWRDRDGRPMGRTFGAGGVCLSSGVDELSRLALAPHRSPHGGPHG